MLCCRGGMDVCTVYNLSTDRQTDTHGPQALTLNGYFVFFYYYYYNNLLAQDRDTNRWIHVYSRVGTEGKGREGKENEEKEKERERETRRDPDLGIHCSTLARSPVHGQR